MAIAESTVTTPSKPEQITVPAGHRLAKYFFKHEKMKDDEGNVIGKGSKHPDVLVAIPMPSNEELITYIASPDGTPEARVGDFIRDSVWDAIFVAGRGQINEWLESNAGQTFKADNLDLSKLSITAIANMPKGSRGAWAPSDDDLKEFNDLYKEVMLRINYPAEKVKVHLTHWKAGMSKVKNNKPVVGKLQELLTAFAANCTEDELADVEQTYTWLDNRATKYLKAEDKNTVEAL